MPCSRKRASPCSPAPRSASKERVSCASPLPIPGTSCAKGPSGSGAASRDCAAEPPGAALQLGEVSPIEDGLFHEVAPTADGDRTGLDVVGGVVDRDPPS